MKIFKLLFFCTFVLLLFCSFSQAEITKATIQKIDGSSLTGCITNADPAPNYMDIGNLIETTNNAGATCSAAYIFNNVGDGNTEDNLCSTGVNLSYCSATNTPVTGCVASAFTESQQSNIGSTYFVTCDGTNDMMAIAHDASLNLPGDYTISLWLKVGTMPETTKNLISKATAGDFEWRLKILASGLLLWEVLDAEEDVSIIITTTALTVGTSHHVIITHSNDVGGIGASDGADYDDGTEIYIDGTVETKSASATSGTFSAPKASTVAVGICNQVGQTSYSNISIAKLIIAKGARVTATRANEMYLKSRGFLCQ
jgi:hypothetical protein